ncbi:glycosyltransferase family 2 protein [Cognataquiflexum aquatile]|uniref:glycosyltransferase family 2 protein n=1 Tax=Cognataquiflexum aquatile TaxID=2249427 RepID=UPI000DEA1B44|nr:glycosyltransferase family 2 protein [Cognataquiflexum aquatile]
MFSVIIPLYNKSQFIERAINSALNQIFKPSEIIVVDDGSTDDGVELVKKLFSSQVELYTQENMGVSAARNYAISKAKSSYIAFLDADDFWQEEYLELISKGIKSFPHAGIWGTSKTSDIVELVKPKGEFYLIEDYFMKYVDRSPFLTSCVVMDSSFFKCQPGFNENLTRGEDLDVWFRAICFFGGAAFCDDKAVFYEKDDPTALTKRNFTFSRSILKVIASPAYTKKIIYKDQKTKKQFDYFRSKFFRIHIAKYFKAPENKEDIEDVISKLNPKMLLIDLFLNLPFSFLHWFFKDGKRSLYFRKYVKSCFKYIY